MSELTVEELIFPSGNRASYIFAEIFAMDEDDLSELDNFPIHGPLREDLDPKSPGYSEFIFSRYLLLALLKHFKKNSVRSVAFSIAHTRGAAVVVGMSGLVDGASLCSGIGVDLEMKDRKISPGVFEKLLQCEHEKNIPATELWCLKEASFKAHPENSGLVLSDFVIEGENESRCVKTGRSFELLFKDENYKLAFARAL